MNRKLLVLGTDGQLALKSRDGTTQPLPKPLAAWALLLIDCSSSMSNSKLDQAKAGALAFADEASRKGYLVGLISFASKANVECGPEDGIAALGRAVESLVASGTTNMSDAIVSATDKIGRLDGARAIVLVSDGEPDDRDATISAASQAKSSGIDIITIGVDGADTEFLRTIATRPDLAVYVPTKELRSGVAGAAFMLPAVTRAT